MTMKIPLRIEARFNSVSTAENARKAISDALNAAEKEASLLFERQGGMAESRDIAAIYAGFGFKNDCGWQQARPLFLKDATLLWEIPEGMSEEEAEQWLSAYGALSIDREVPVEDDDLMYLVPHPAALFLAEIDETQDFEDDDQALRGEGLEKKTIH
jgi:hypothetical protein